MKKFCMKLMALGIICSMLMACGSTATSSGSSSEADIEETESVEEASEDTEAIETEEGEIVQASESFFAMDTYMTVTAYGVYAEDAVAAAVAEIERLDLLLSTGDEDSEISQINAAGGGVLSADTAYLFEKSLEIYEMTGGAFNVAIYPVMKLWGFADQDFAIPDDDELDEALALADMSLIEYDSETCEISFTTDGVEIDLGGIVKGYAAELVMSIFEEYGIVSGLANLGGDIWTYSTKVDGSLWRVAIQDPDDSSAYIGIISVAEISVVTSGDYERYFEEDGVRYHHIVDPETGYPADNGLRSVTVICEDGALADGLSTSVFIMGIEKASEFWREYSDVFDMILFDADGNMYVSEGIADSFTSDLDYVIIEK